MSSTSLVIALLCAPIMAQPQLLNATVGGSILIPCLVPVDLNMNITWLYWQEHQSTNILLHWENGKRKPVYNNYENRCEVFSSHFSSGNISIRLDNVAVGDDKKTFWAFVNFSDQHKTSKIYRQKCKSTLQVSAPYQGLVLTVDEAANIATCTAHGGYPEPHVSWTGQNKSSTTQLDLKDAQTSLALDPTNKTFSVTSSVSVKGLHSVTCFIDNNLSNHIIKKSQDWNTTFCFTSVFTVLAVLLVVVLVVVCGLIYFRRQQKCGNEGKVRTERAQPTEAPSTSAAAGGDSADRQASDAASGEIKSDDTVSLKENQAAYHRPNGKKNEGANSETSDNSAADDDAEEKIKRATETSNKEAHEKAL